MRTTKQAKASMADGGQSDRLSDLPDSILHHIFSFIDTRYAVRASVLSSRWRHLWKSLSYLYFDWETKQPKKIAATADLVNMILSFRDRESEIQCFRLQSVSSKNFRLVYSWILNAIRHNVRVIDIDYEYVSGPIEWPHSLFSYNSLTTLKLSSIYQLFVLPDSISLPNLKVLHLEDVDFADIKTGSCVSNLITSCPSLESLEVSCMNLGFGDKFVISAPKLERLVIYDNVKPFMKEMKKFEMKICAPNLRTFRCKDRISNEYSMGELRFLDSASIDMVMVKGCHIEPFKILDNLLKDKKWEYVQHLAGLLKAVCGAKSLCLKLSALLIVVMVEIFESPVEDLHMQFNNLKYVKLQTCVTRECVLAIIHLLNASPQIEIVSLQNIVNVTSWEQLHEDERMLTSANMVEWSDLGLSNQCMIHHRLKVLEIHSFIGCLNELKLLQMMLKNAAALEEMLIWTMKDEMTSGRKEHLINFKKMLLKTPRASSNVAISFFIESLKA